VINPRKNTVIKVLRKPFALHPADVNPALDLPPGDMLQLCVDYRRVNENVE